MLGSILGGILSGGGLGSLQIDDTPTVDETAAPGVDQQPQSGGSIVDEILGGLFGKR